MTTTDPIDLLGAVRAARAELDRTKGLRAAGEAGYSDVCRADYRLGLAIQRARDAGLLPYNPSSDTSAMLGEGRADRGVGQVGMGS